MYNNIPRYLYAVIRIETDTRWHLHTVGRDAGRITQARATTIVIE